MPARMDLKSVTLMEKSNAHKRFETITDILKSTHKIILYSGYGYGGREFL